MDLFGSTRALRALNVAAVGLALASCTAAGLTQTMQLPGLATGPSTLLAGMAWALCMRSRRRVGKGHWRAGWLWSVPIAMANAAISCALYIGLDHGPYWMGLVFGPTLGVLAWGPALVFTLVCFGLPIAWSQQLAERGLAGEERGEAIVGFICAALGLVGLTMALQVPGPPVWWNQELLAQRDHGLWFGRIAGALGLALGLASTALATRRDLQRRAFVERVHAGDVHGFRVDETHEGRVLVRITELGAGYRVTNFTEELYELDETGEVTHARASRGARSGEV